MNTDEELRNILILSGINIIRDVLHKYSFGGVELCCVTCDYYCKRCWLCMQCRLCCELSEKDLEERDK